MARAPFKLRSGNSTSYKEMASSPVDLKNFGVGPGATPTGESPLDQPVADPDEYANQLAQNKGQENGKGQGWKTAAGLVGSMLTSGLDAVYGSGKVVPMSDRLLKKDKKEECPLGYKRNAAGNCVKIGE